jgi:hypothetical protein
MADVPNLPDEIVATIPKAILKLSENKSWEVQHSVRNSIELWIESSWNIAKGLGLSPQDYVEWMLLGNWNLAGDTGDLKIVSEYTKLAGSQGWALKKAGVPIADAIQLAAEEGLEAVVENAKIMSGLSGLYPAYEDSSEISTPQPKQEQKDYKIEFPTID